MRTKRNNVKSDPNTEPVVVTSIRMTPEQHESLKALAHRRHRSVSGELRVAIDTHIAQGLDELQDAA